MKLSDILLKLFIVTIQILPAYDLYLFNQAISGQEVAAESAYAKLCADVCRCLQIFEKCCKPFAP